MNKLFNEFLCRLDIVEFIEEKLILEGKPFSYTKNGRAFMKDVLRYCAHVLPNSKKARPAIIVKGRQTGASTMTAALTLYYMYNEDHKNILHSFPDVGMARRHSSARLQQLLDDSMSKLGGLESSFQNKQGINSLAQKDFQKGNILYVEGISKDARRIRGMSVDLICYDEMASTTRQAFENSLQAAANTSFEYINGGAIIPHFMFGTPESENSFFHEVWKRSDQRKYFLKCQKCGHYFPLFFKVVNRDQFETNLHEGTLVKCLDENGVGCQAINSKIGSAMEQGKWMSTQDFLPDGDPPEYTGFFVPQFLNGKITKEMIVSQFEKMPAREFYNEVLGLFYSFEDDVLTKGDIIKYTTTNPDTNDWDFPPHVLDKQTFMGIDWGARVSGVDDTGSGSYTVVTVFSLLPTGHLKLEHACRLRTNDTDEKVAAVTNLMRRYNVLKCVADKGFGQSEGQRLQKLHGVDRFTMCEWGGSRKRAFVYTHDNNTISADKHIAHETFFDQIKQGKFCFPYSLKAEQEIDWLLDHMINIEVKNVEQNGIIKKRYDKKHGKETDGLASLIYAYTAFQFWKTNGFALNINQSKNSIGQRGTSGLQPYVVRNVGRGSPTRPINYSRSDRRRR